MKDWIAHFHRSQFTSSKSDSHSTCKKNQAQLKYWLDKHLERIRITQFLRNVLACGHLYWTNKSKFLIYSNRLTWNWACASLSARISSIELQRTGSVRSSSAFSNHELKADAFFAKVRYSSSIRRNWSCIRSKRCLRAVESFNSFCQLKKKNFPIKTREFYSHFFRATPRIPTVWWRHRVFSKYFDFGRDWRQWVDLSARLYFEYLRARMRGVLRTIGEWLNIATKSQGWTDKGKIWFWIFYRR